MELIVESRRVASREVQLAPGENAIDFNTRLPTEGDNIVRARVQATEDQIEENDELSIR